MLPPGLKLLGAAVVATENSTVPDSAAAAPRYTADLPRHAPISSSGPTVAPSRPARYSAIPSSSGRNPRVQVARATASSP
ncbi:MAG: hypothetical protein QOD63_295 [Actinomycetota bacterium]|nr:hypothetical protein [Actinomycetota bacterium]